MFTIKLSITKSCCENRLDELFDVESIEANQKNPIPIRPRQDKLMWIEDHKGCFSVKSSYRLCQDQPLSTINVLNWHNIWNKKMLGYIW